MKRGGRSYRVRLDDGSIVPLGWNLSEAMARYHELRPARAAENIEETAKALLSRHRQAAKKRGIEFALTASDIESMLRASKGRCDLTGRPFSMEKPAGQRIRPYAPSIDRRNSMLGYTVDNTRIICAFVNISLNRFGEAMFVEMVESIVRRVVRDELAARSDAAK